MLPILSIHCSILHYKHIATIGLPYVGSLPWQDLNASPRVKQHGGIMRQKSSVVELYSGIPDEFCTFLLYARTLTFEAELDYTHIRTLFKSLFKRCGYENDGVFDWSGGF